MGSRSSDSRYAEKVVAAPAGEQEARAVTPGDGPRAAAGAVAGMAVEELLDRRAQARADKDFALSDTLRDELKNLHVEVRDTPSGQVWDLILD